MMTQDMDLAGGDHFMIGLPTGAKALSEVVMASEKDFFSIPTLDIKSHSTSFKIRNKSFSVDLLTPLVGKPTSSPIFVKAMSSYASPLRFLDYLLDDCQKCLMLHKQGVVVNVPTPARFAIHKLVVSQRRPTAEQAKVKKDIDQAVSVIEVLSEIRPYDIDAAMCSVSKMPDKFKRQLDAGAKIAGIKL